LNCRLNLYTYDTSVLAYLLKEEIMSVLMWEVNKAGNTIAQCDGRCYGSRFPYKYCICGGKNHAMGRAAALLNTRNLFRSGKFPDGFRFPPFIKQEILHFTPFPFPGSRD